MFTILGCSGCHKKMPPTEWLEQQKSMCSQFYRLVAQDLGSTGVGFLKMALSLAFRLPASHCAFSGPVLGGLERELSSLLTRTLILQDQCMCVSYFSRVQFFATPWTVVYQAPLFMGFSRQEYWGGLPFPSPGDLPDQDIKHPSTVSPALASGFFTSSVTWEAHRIRAHL